jgi:kynurenine 3-monooxygenase
LDAIRRKDLIAILLSLAAKENRIELLFEHTLEMIEFDTQQVQCSNTSNSTKLLRYDFLVGADGANSKVRSLAGGRFDTSEHQELSDWHYIEFPLSPATKLSRKHIHLWPRTHSTVCAIPNSDGTWVANLIATSPLIEQVCSDRSYKTLSAIFPDLPLEQSSQISGARTSSRRFTHVSVRPWQFTHSAILIGDASHAISPFLGQGMNAALEDAHYLKKYLVQYDLPDALTRFEQTRIPHTSAVSLLSRRHSVLLTSQLSSMWTRARLRAEARLAAIFPAFPGSGYYRLAHTTDPIIGPSRSWSAQALTRLVANVAALAFCINEMFAMTLHGLTKWIP